MHHYDHHYYALLSVVDDRDLSRAAAERHQLLAALTSPTATRRNRLSAGRARWSWPRVTRRLPAAS